MNKSVFALFITLAAGTGCATNSSVYQDLPLVSQVQPGMSKEQVLHLGGQPLSQSERANGAGTCLDYMLVKQGQQQAYSVDFNDANKVEGKHFATCAQAAHQSARKALDNMGGVGGAGY